jgi:hypothetical protein
VEVALPALAQGARQMGLHRRLARAMAREAPSAELELVAWHACLIGIPRYREYQSRNDGRAQRPRGLRCLMHRSSL